MISHELADHDNAKSKLPLALGIAAGLAVVMTVISVSAYHLGGFSALDLSRPGYEAERVNTASPSGYQAYDNSSPLTTGALSDVLNKFDQRQADLNTYGSFNDDALRDEIILDAKP